MSEEIIKVLDNLAQRFGIVIDWTSQNIMPYIQNLMGRYMQYHIASIILALILEIMGIFIFIKVLKSALNKKKDDKYWEWFNEGIYYTIPLTILGIVLAILIPVTIDTLLQDIFIPEVTMLNYIKSLM